jgi:hypothetical protein
LYHKKIANIAIDEMIEASRIVDEQQQGQRRQQQQEQQVDGKARPPGGAGR